MSETMKVIKYANYGSPEVLQMETVAKPKPSDDEVLIRIRATTVTATECAFRKGDPFLTRLFTGLRRPKINQLGEELAGEIEAVGQNVHTFRVGDRVFGTAGPRFGANAEYICVREDGVLAKMPSGIGFEEAAGSVDGFLTAMPFLRDTGGLKPGQHVLVYGASGSVGAAAVQVAKYLGATVTAVCSAANHNMVRRIGADNVIDYIREDFTQAEKTYNVVFDAVGKTSFSSTKGVLTRRGVFLQAGIGVTDLLAFMWTALFGRKKVKFAATGLRPPHERQKDLALLRQLLETRVVQPVIDRSYPLENIVEAHRYVDKGHKRGNVVVNVSSSRRGAGGDC